MRFLGALAILLVSMCGRAGAEDGVIAELAPELARSLDRLELPGQPAPYYLAFSHVSLDRVEAAACLGGVINDKWRRQCYLQARMRVGSTLLDNANFAGYGGLSGTVRVTALEVADPPLARDAWLAADAALKRCLVAFADKEGALKREQPRERPPEFSPYPAQVKIAEEVRLSGLDRARARDLVRGLSEKLRSYPDIQRAEVRLDLRADTVRLLDSDGFRHRQPQRMAQLIFTAEAQAEDGTPLREVLTEMAPSLEELPAAEEMEEKIKRAAGRLVERRAAGDLPGPYLGPVLFTARAAAEFVRQTLAGDFSGTPSPVTQSDGMKSMVRAGQLARFLGLRVLPEWMDVSSEPDRAELDGLPLMGAYSVDREGVPGRRVSLVEGGKLKAFLMSRTPSKEFGSSNGHGRIIAGNTVRAAPANLLFRARRGDSEAKLVKRLVKLAKREGLEFGLIVRRLDEPPGDPGVVRRINVGTGDQDPEEAPSRWAISPALDISLVNVRTREEIRLRGAVFGPIGIAELRGIVAAGMKSAVYSFVISPDRIDYYQGYAEEAVASISAPSLLFSQLEVRPMAERREPAPLLPHPLAFRTGK